MSLLNDIIGGVLGGGQDGGRQGQLFEALENLGGLDGVLDRLREGGAGDAIGSWIAQGANAQITPERIRAILGDGPIAQAAQRMGVSPEQISQIIAAQLPALIDRMTPDGDSPGGGFADILGGLLRTGGR